MSSITLTVKTDTGPVVGAKECKKMHWLKGLKDSGVKTGYTFRESLFDKVSMVVMTCRNNHEAYLVGLTQGLTSSNQQLF